MVRKFTCARTIFLLVLTLLFNTLQAQTCVFDSLGSTYPNVNGGAPTATAVDKLGNVYFASGDASLGGRLVVRKFNGTSWSTVGATGLSIDFMNSIDMACDTLGNPWVIFSDNGATVVSSGKAVVKKFNGSTWASVGSTGSPAGVSPNDAEYVNIAFDKITNTPYIAYKDAYSSTKAKVQKLVGSTWTNVVSATISTGQVWDINMEIDSAGKVYVSYQDDVTSFGNGKATVRKYDGSSWSNVGSAEFTSEAALGSCLALDKNSTPYLSCYFSPGGGFIGSYVFKFNGTSWDSLGTRDKFHWVSTVALDNTNTPYRIGAPYDFFAGVSPVTTIFKYNGVKWDSVTNVYNGDMVTNYYPTDFIITDSYMYYGGYDVNTGYTYVMDRIIIDKRVTLSGTTLTSKQAAANAYQWIKCGTPDVAQAGATSQSYTPTVTGSYKVALLKNGCRDTSACISVTIAACSLTATASNTGPYCAGATISVSATPSGGTAPYTYSWASSAGGAWAATGSPATRASSTTAMSGAYNVTVTDAGSCTATVATSVTVNANPSAPTLSVTQPTCSSANGSVAVTSTTTGLTFSTDGTNYAAYTAAYTVAANAAYSITAKNGSGCVSPAASGTMGAQPGAPSAPTLSVTQPTCSSANGSVAVTSTTTGLTFSTDGTNYAAYTAAYTVAANAAYSITAKNGSGCVSPAASGTMGAQPGAPSAPTLSVTQPTCSSANGSVAVTSTTTGLTFSTDGTNYAAYTAAYTVAANAAYSITAKNGSGCVSPAASGTMGAQPGAPSAPTLSVTQPTCSSANGSVAVTSTTTGLTFSTDGTNYAAYTAAYTVAANAAYSITAKNGSGCVSPAASGTMGAQPGAPSAPTLSVTQPTCSSANGSVAVTSTTTGLTFSTDGTNYAAYTAAYTVAANAAYSITAKNGSGCVSPAASGTMGAQPGAPSAPTLSVTQPTCSSANGSVAVTSTTTGLTFSTDGTNYAAYTAAYTVAANAAYSITAKNGSGCVSPAASGTMGAQPGAPSAPTLSVTQPTCSSANGSVAVTSTTTGLTFSTDGTNYAAYTAAYTVAANAAYSITAKNGSGCVSPAASGTMGAQPGAPSAPTISITAASCSVAGTATITNYIGSLIYTFTPAGPSAGVGGAISSMVAGTSYTVKAFNGTCNSAFSASFSIAAQLAPPATPTITTLLPTYTPCAFSSINPFTLTSITLNAGPHTNASYQWANITNSQTLGNAQTQTLTAIGNETYAVTVTITGGNGCTSSATAQTSIQPLTPTAITINAPVYSSPPPACGGNATISVTQSGLTNYKWFSGTNFATPIAGANSNTYTVTTTGSTSYMVSANDANGCIAANASAVNVTLYPAVTATATSSVTCAGSPLTLSGGASGYTTYAWSGPNSYVVANNQNPTVNSVATTAMSGTYTVTVTQSGCTATASTTVAIGAASVGGTATPLQTDICLNGTASFQLTGYTGTVLRWESQFNGNTWYPLPQSNQANFTTNMLSQTGTYKFWAVVQSGNCAEANSNEVTVNVYVPQITGTLAVCESGGTTLLTGSPSPSPTDTWTSTNGNATISNGLNSPTATLTGVAAGNTTITYTDFRGCQGTANLTVDAATVGGTISPATQEFCEDNNPLPLTLTGNTGGVSFWEYIKVGGPVWEGLSNTSTTLALSFSGFTGVGNYLVRTVVKNGSCPSAYSNEATIILKPRAFITSGLPSTACVGSSYTLTGSGTPSPTSPWQSSNPLLVDITPAGIMTAIVGLQTSIITYTNSFGCSKTQVVFGTDTPVITPNPATACVGQTIVLTSSIQFLSWTSNPASAIVDFGVLGGEFTASSSGQYVVSATDGGCTGRSIVNVIGPVVSITTNPNTTTLSCTNTSIVLTATGGGTYQWNATGGSATTAGIAAIAAGTYEVTVTENSCTATAAVQITGTNAVANTVTAATQNTAVLDPSWPQPDGEVYAIVRAGNTVYLGGTFTTIGGQARNSIAAIDATTHLVTEWNPNANNNVFALAVSGSNVYAGGDFTTIGGQTRNYIAALDATTGLATAWNPDASSTIQALAVSGSNVYAGGDFTTIGAQTRNNIAALDATTGLATAWNPNANSDVFALSVSGSNVYAGGVFSTIGGQSRNKIAALDVATGTATAWNPNANGTVFALAVSGSNVYAGGDFNTIGGQSRIRIAALDATTGTATTWNPNASDDVIVLAVSGSNVYAGGRFTTIGGQTRNYIAALDATTGIATDWNPNANFSVWALAESGSNVYAGGDFTSIGGQSRNNFAVINSASTFCVNSIAPNTVHTTTGATGIGTATNLPPGFTATWADNTITISGTPTQTGTFDYSIPLTGGCGGVNATGTIIVKGEAPKVELAPEITMCNEGEIKIQPKYSYNGIENADEIDGLTYNWVKPGIPVYIGYESAYTTTVSGAYTVNVSAAAGSCEASAQTNVSIVPGFELEIVIPEELECHNGHLNPQIGEQITLYSKVTDAVGTPTYLWTAGSGFDIPYNTEPTIAFVFNSKNAEIITLTATAGGCTETATVTVDPYLTINAAFSPNGDGNNDVLEATGTADLTNARWCVRQSSQEEEVACGLGPLNWDGKHYSTGKDCPERDYTVTLWVNGEKERFDKDKKRNQYERVITLTR